MSVRKNAFMLSSAELMLVKYGTTPVFDLQPELHSVGLSQEIAINLDSSQIDLTTGIAQAIVDSKRTNVQAMIMGTVREYSAENLLRAQGLATGAVTARRGKLVGGASAGAVSLTIVSDPVPGDESTALGTAAGDIPANSTILIQHPTIPELVFPARTTGASTYLTGQHTIPIAAPYAIPSGMAFPTDALVWIVTEMGIGSTEQTDLFSVKIVGTLANFNRPIVAVFPKVQIIKGFNLSFTETEYGSMPWEMRPLLLASSEATGRLSEVGTRAPGKLYAA